MPEKTIKRRLEDTRDSALASDDGPIFSTVAKLVEARKRSIPGGTENAERKSDSPKRGKPRWTEWWSGVNSNSRYRSPGRPSLSTCVQ